MRVIYICRVRFPHAECDFYTQRVISTRSMILKRTNVITTLTTLISKRETEIFTRRVWCWHVWVLLWHSRKWLWHSYVLKSHSACGNHSCVWCSHAYYDEHKHKCNFWTQSVNFTWLSVIYIRRMWFLNAECNFHTQCDVETHKCYYDTHDCDFNTHKSDFCTQSVILTRMSVIYTRTSWILTRCVWL
jgi:hypothetical protein